jgi:lactate dehydrogenase-like 2-hydroxyacid dehydrogenase
VIKLQGYTPLLMRCPNLLALSTNGAGFDTVSVSDATAAGVAVANQAGGNKEGVAEQVMAMMLRKVPSVGAHGPSWPMRCNQEFEVEGTIGHGGHPPERI